MLKSAPHLHEVSSPELAERDVFFAVREAIEGGRFPYGERLPSIRELAQQYDLSPAAVRTALGRLERLGLIKRRQGSGSYVTYRAGTAVRPDLTRAGELQGEVALLLDPQAHVLDTLSAALIHHLQDAGLSAVTVGWRARQGVGQLAGVLQRWRHRPPYAIVLNWIAPELDKAIAEVCGGRSRIITTMRRPFTAGEDPVHAVDCDYDAADELALRYLLKEGHRRIGVVLCARQISRDNPSTLRKRTTLHTSTILRFGRALRELGVRNGLKIIYQNLGEGPAELLAERRVDGLVQLLSRDDRPTALFGNDFRLLPVIQAAQRLRLRIPEDLMLLGSANTPWSRGSGFPSVSLEEECVARQIAVLILQDGPLFHNSSHRVLVQPRLVLRDSVASSSISASLQQDDTIGSQRP